MIRVLKTDLFRLFRSKVLYVYPIVVVFILILGGVFAAVVQKREVETPNESTEAYSEEEETDSSDNRMISVSVELNQDVIGKDNGKTIISADTFTESLYDGSMLLFLAITVVIFCTCESRDGFIKNAVGCVDDRNYMVFSKIIIGIVAMAIYAVEFAVLNTIFTLLFGTLNGNEIVYRAIPEGEGGKYLGYLMLCILVNITIICLLVMLHEIAHNRALGIVIGFMISAGIIEDGITSLVHLLSDKITFFANLKIEKYMLFNNISNGYKGDSYYPDTLLVMTILYMAVFTLAAVTISKRHDVR